MEESHNRRKFLLPASAVVSPNAFLGIAQQVLSWEGLLCKCSLISLAPAVLGMQLHQKNICLLHLEAPFPSENPCPSSSEKSCPSPVFVALGPNVTPRVSSERLKNICCGKLQRSARFHLTFSRGIANSWEEPESLYSECSSKPHVHRFRHKTMKNSVRCSIRVCWSFQQLC